MTALTVLVTGGSSASGVAAARALATAGHRVLTVGSDPARIQAAAAEAGGGVEPMVSDLASLESVQELARTLEDRGIGGVDGVIHLVGGWRGAKGIEDQSDDDWQAMERSAVTTLRNVSRVFYGQLEKSPNGRFAMVSSTTASAPTAATASYAAAKSAAEAWTLSIADGFRRSASNDSTSTDSQESSAAVILVVKALVDPAMRLKNPERRFPGYTDVEDLASAVVELFTQPAAQLNGQRILLAK
ncbi:SDR family NAD(P)-dependent oxidoreductase [Paenarthrobacter ilicis]|uniref:SDR family NAD(P)-dependent oxidoreductase n=1 Tax=Paenarthrobacter ilicis TaxID=43665 RepID=UPI00386DA7B7